MGREWVSLAGVAHISAHFPFHVAPPPLPRLLFIHGLSLVSCPVRSPPRPPPPWPSRICDPMGGEEHSDLKDLSAKVSDMKASLPEYFTRMIVEEPKTIKKGMTTDALIKEYKGIIAKIPDQINTIQCQLQLIQGAHALKIAQKAQKKSSTAGASPAAAS